MDTHSSGRTSRPFGAILFVGSAVALLLASLGVALIVVGGLVLSFIFLMFSGGF